MSFASGNDDTDLNVSKGGTVEFSFAIQFSQAGPRGLREEVNRFELRNTAKRLLVECQINGHADCRYMNNNDHQWWTVMGEDIYSITFILHQAQSTDRGPYTARIEGVDPAQRSIDTIDKEYRVIGKYFLLHVYYMYTCIYCTCTCMSRMHDVMCFNPTRVDFLSECLSCHDHLVYQAFSFILNLSISLRPLVYLALICIGDLNLVS